MSNLSCGTHVAEPSANKDCRKLLNQFCRFLPKLKLPISADAKLPLTQELAMIGTVRKCCAFPNELIANVLEILYL